MVFDSYHKSLETDAPQGPAAGVLLKILLAKEMRKLHQRPCTTSSHTATATAAVRARASFFFLPILLLLLAFTGGSAISVLCRGLIVNHPAIRAQQQCMSPFVRADHLLNLPSNS